MALQPSSHNKPVATDPVCGMEVVPEQTALSATHQSKTYYFCSPGCLKKFQVDPKKYFSAQTPEEQTDSAKEKTEYTCPMHPEIVRDRPGNCPICGMALEPRTVSLEEEKNPELLDMSRRFGYRWDSPFPW